MRMSEGYQDAGPTEEITIVKGMAVVTEPGGIVRRANDILINDFPETIFREILNRDPEDDDTRSQVVGIRLPNGDLVLGVFPQGDTYEEVTQFYGV